MTLPFDTAALTTVAHYLQQVALLIDRVTQEPEVTDLLQRRLAPDMQDTGFHLAVAMGFAARALALPAGHPVPDIPDEITPTSLRAYHTKIAALIAPIAVTDLTSPVYHQAGDADLEQEVSDYILRFALPNMIFHLSMAYAGLRHAGLDIGKANFDGLHAYTRPLT